MTKTIYPLLAVMLASCGGNASASHDTCDSAAEAQALMGTSASNVATSSLDLTALELQGPVKKVVWTDNGNTYTAEYDTQGNLTFAADKYGEFQIFRNDDGCPVFYAVGAGSVLYSVDPKHDRLACMSGGEGSYSWERNYKYDNKGKLQSVEFHIEDEADGTNSTEVHTLAYITNDHHDNWVFRRFGKGDKALIYNRDIVYYNEENKESKRVDRQFKPFSDKLHFEGLIGGNDNCTLDLEGGTGNYVINNAPRSIKVTEYNEWMGEIKFDAMLGERVIGSFEGVYTRSPITGPLDTRQGILSGMFTNVNGGKVGFTLILK